MTYLVILLTALFAINDAGDRVEFAPANLVYEDGVYSFAEHEYDYGTYFDFTAASAAQIEADSKAWRLLTQDEMDYILEHYTRSWVTDYLGSGINGYLLTGEGGTAFFPAAGYKGFTSKTYHTGTTADH